MRAPVVTARGSTSGAAYRPATGSRPNAVTACAASRHMDMEHATSRMHGESDMRSIMLPRAHLHP
jgi:hypothetical protein